MNEALIIFVRNPVLGKVKTRLAHTIGNEKALQVYLHLLNHTKQITQKVAVTKYVYYADFINDDDIWNGYKKRLQQGYDLGERMNNAFEEVLNTGYKKCCIIGSDCFELTTEIINEAFEKLNITDVAIGAANDGGYYLLGLKKLLPDLFINKHWSSASVYNNTIADIKRYNFSISSLKILNDIDEATDFYKSNLADMLN